MEKHGIIPEIKRPLRITENERFLIEVALQFTHPDIISTYKNDR